MIICAITPMSSITINFHRNFGSLKGNMGICCGEIKSFVGTAGYKPRASGMELHHILLWIDGNLPKTVAAGADSGIRIQKRLGIGCQMTMEEIDIDEHKRRIEQDGTDQQSNNGDNYVFFARHRLYVFCSAVKKPDCSTAEGGKNKRSSEISAQSVPQCKYNAGNQWEGLDKNRTHDTVKQQLEAGGCNCNQNQRQE